MIDMKVLDDRRRRVAGAGAAEQVTALCLIDLVEIFATGQGHQDGVDPGLLKKTAAALNDLLAVFEYESSLKLRYPSRHEFARAALAELKEAIK